MAGPSPYLMQPTRSEARVRIEIAVRRLRHAVAVLKGLPEPVIQVRSQISEAIETLEAYSAQPEGETP